jgi:predicted nucleotidyltransferase
MFMKRQARKSIREVVEQVVELAHPLRIILFGSVAEGNAGPDSDLDFLVVVSEKEETNAIADRLNMGVRRRSMPCDFLVVKQSTLGRHLRNPGLLYGEILERGIEVYAGG